MIQEFVGTGDAQKQAGMALKEVFEGFEVSNPEANIPRPIDVLRSKTTAALGDRAKGLTEPEMRVHMWATLQKFAEDNSVGTDPKSISDALDPDENGKRKLDLANL